MQKNKVYQKTASDQCEMRETQMKEKKDGKPIYTGYPDALCSMRKNRN